MGKARSNENIEANRMFGIKNIRQSFRPPEPILSECKIKRPHFATELKDGIKRIMDLRQAIFFDCPICVIGKVIGDKRRRLRASQCSNCQNCFYVVQNAGGEFKMQYTSDIIPSPDGSDW